MPTPDDKQAADAGSAEFERNPFEPMTTQEGPPTMEQAYATTREALELAANKPLVMDEVTAVPRKAFEPGATVDVRDDPGDGVPGKGLMPRTEVEEGTRERAAKKSVDDESYEAYVKRRNEPVTKQTELDNHLLVLARLHAQTLGYIDTLRKGAKGRAAADLNCAAQRFEETMMWVNKSLHERYAGS